MVSVNLYSENSKEIEKFLSSFYNSSFDINEEYISMLQKKMLIIWLGIYMKGIHIKTTKRKNKDRYISSILPFNNLYVTF